MNKGWISEKECNGWKNYGTWNVALWLSNDETIYKAIQEYCKHAAEPSYHHFVKWYGLTKTPDNVPYIHPSLDMKALQEAFLELVEA